MATLVEGVMGSIAVETVYVNGSSRAVAMRTAQID